MEDAKVLDQIIDVYVHGPVPQTRTKKEFFTARAEYISGAGWSSYEDV